MIDVEELETSLRDLFERQQRAVPVRPAPWYGPPVAERPQRMWRDRPTRHRWRFVAAWTVVAVAVIAGLAVIATREPRGAGQADGGGEGFNLSSPQVLLTASDVQIVIGDRTFRPTDARVTSDPGNESMQTLEVTWQQHAVEMRWNLYFASDGVDWWVTEMRVYNGKQAGSADWVTYPADKQPTPLGVARDNTDLDLTSTEKGITARLIVTGMTLQPFRINKLDPVPVNGTVVVLPPKPAVPVPAAPDKVPVVVVADTVVAITLDTVSD